MVHVLRMSAVGWRGGSGTEPDSGGINRRRSIKRTAGKYRYRHYSFVCWINCVWSAAGLNVDLHRDELHWSLSCTSDCQIKKSPNGSGAVIRSIFGRLFRIGSSYVDESQSVVIHRPRRIRILEREAAQRSSRSNLVEAGWNLSYVGLVRGQRGGGCGLPMNSIPVCKNRTGPARGAGD